MAKNYNKEDDRWLAYILETVHHEISRTIQPIDEFGKGAEHVYSKRFKMAKGADGKHIPYIDTTKIFYGRGFVQLT